VTAVFGTPGTKREKKGSECEIHRLASPEKGKRKGGKGSGKKGKRATRGTRKKGQTFQKNHNQSNPIVEKIGSGKGSWRKSEEKARWGRGGPQKNLDQLFLKKNQKKKKTT